jgi:integrase
MARSNIRQQFLRAILGCCKFGEKKHEYKRGTESGGSGYMPETPWIFSDNYKESLKEYAFMFAKYMNEHHNDIKYFGKIRVKHWNEFLEMKAGTCSTKTLGLYVSHIKKLEMCIEQHWELKHPLNWTKGLIKPDSMKTPTGELLRVQQMTRGDFNKIIEHTHRAGTWSKAPIAFELSARFGLRVAECASICAKNIYLDEPGKWGHGYVDIWGKGKRYRKIDIKTQDDREYITKAITSLSPDDKIVGISDDQINIHLRRACKELKVKAKYPVTGIHSIRKLYSQETFRFVQAEKGMTEQEAVRYVNAQLGHSEERDTDLLAVYVKDVKRKKDREKKNART